MFSPFFFIRVNTFPSLFDFIALFIENLETT